MIKFMMITNDPIQAQLAESSGVGRIFVDLEWLGKKERQGHLDTYISNHSMEDVAKVKHSLVNAELLVRLNPLNRDTYQEVERAINNGAEILMLPMFRTGDEVKEFVRIVDRRVKIIPLVETFDAVKSINEVVNIPSVSEIYIGLNDLYLDMKMSFIFQPLADGLIDSIAGIIKSAGLPFGFGGVARIGDGSIPGELVLSEHVRLGSSWVILSRTFYRDIDSEFASGSRKLLTNEIKKLENTVGRLILRSEEQIISDCHRLRKLVKNIIESKVNEKAV